jgi:hypothetical protein
MSCESYKNALTAAAAGAPAASELRSHLIACSSCRTALAGEESLFAAIDGGLHSVVNVEVPASLAPSVRARIAAGVAPRRAWLPALALVSAATLAVVLIVVQVTHRTEQSKVPSPIPTASRAPLPEVVPPPLKTLEQKTSVTAVSTTHQHGPAQPTKSGEPLVMVAPRQREAVDALMAVFHQAEKQEEVLIAEAQDDVAQPLSIAPIAVVPMEIKALDFDAKDLGRAVVPSDVNPKPISR